MRAANRIAAGLLGVLLIVVGLVAAVEAVLVAADRQPWPPTLRRWLESWADVPVGNRGVLIGAIVAAVVGLAILVAEVRRWRPSQLPAGDLDRGVWWLSRRSVEHRTGAAVETTADVHNARARVLGGQRHWRVRVTAQGGPEQQGVVEHAVRDELDRLSLPEAVPVEVSLHLPGRVA